MGVNGRRSNYTLLSQIPDEQHHQQPPAKVAAVAAQYYESQIMGKSDRGFDWELVDQRVVPPQSRMGATAFSGTIGSQRHSSGSSFGESSISGDYYVPSLSNPDGFVQLHDDGGVELLLNTAEGGGGGGSSSTKSWAQQTEESYQLQLALALRLSSEATCADDPNFLDPVTDESMARSSSSSASAEAMSHRFWVKGSLSYLDKVPDGFYLIHGIDPCIWSVCVDFEENGRIPSIESLKNLDPGAESSIEVILIDRFSDPSLKELQNRIHTLSCSCITLNEVVDHLAKLVCSHMGGVSHIGEDHLIPNWKECTDELKDCLRSVVLLIGSLPIGLCRHRALLFKVLADTIGLPCRIAKGCKYCTRDDASSCVVRFGFDREYMVDLIGNPGCLCEPDSLLNGPSSISISSPLCFPRLRQVEPPIDFRSLAKQYFADSLSLNLVFDDSSAGDVQHQHLLPGTSGNNDVSHSALLPLNAWQEGFNRDSPKSDFSRNIPPIGHTDDVQQSLPSNDLRFGMEDLDIPWSDLVLKEGIGVGSFGNVHRADWNGCDVAVKILMEQDFHEERVNEFLREVAIMKRLRHPNIVLFMGAVTQPPNLSIVTEYLSRGSLFKLLHKPGGREALDERRRLLMAYDVAKGMNYLHKHNPPIVHRDLKSPNLLVDKKYTVKVCDFGLSRLKANTYLSSKSLAGTPEWMAPEVLRNEQSNEKSDVYSFGVILWELVTMQQPWRNLNAAQVVAAVGFQYKRLEIPKDLNPKVAAIIEACFANEPWKRPSFASIMESLRPLTKVPTPLSMPSLT